MAASPVINWPRIAAEGAAIVTSILLAFAIDAWWQQRNEQQLTDTLYEGLHDDFQSSQAHISQWLAGNELMFDALTQFRDQLAAAGIGSELDVPVEWIISAIGAPTYSPTESTLQAAISSGQIEQIQNIELRTKLAVWRQQLDDTAEDELLIRQIVVNQLVPILGRQARLSGAFEFDKIVPWFTGNLKLDPDETVHLQVTTDLEAVIAERLFYTTFVVSGLAEIRTTQAEILRLLQ